MRAIAIGLLMLLQFTPFSDSQLAKSLEPTVVGQAQVNPELTLHPVPIKHGGTELNLGAKSTLALDMDSGVVLHSQNPNQVLPIASITKLVTILVILQNHTPDELITIPVLPAYGPAEQKLGLSTGQQFRLDDLTKAALIPSHNDVADALAIADSGSLANFSKKMNDYVRGWGITDCNFTNPSGLQDNFASAASLAKLAKIALSHPLIADAVKRRSATITSLAGQSYNLHSTNQLLGDPRFAGLKTGYTPSAGQSLVGYAKLGSHRVVTVILNSPDRFGETQTLINWIEANYRWL